MMVFPEFDPIAVHIGSFGVRWYALAYIAGILLGCMLLKRLLQKPFAGANIAPALVDDFMIWAVLGIVIGGRLGYVLFYNLPHFWAHPADIFMLWQGGMAFHGGAAGVITALYFFARMHRVSFVSLGDAVCAIVPIGLFFGRLANFINGELVGRATSPDNPFAMIFPHVDALPRHPSQLYEAFGEGLVLFALLQYLTWRTQAPTRPGAIAGLFLAGYGAARFIVEYTREPDVQLGLLWGGLSMGQWLCVPMILAGLGLVSWARFKRV